MDKEEQQLVDAAIPMQIGDVEYSASMLTDRDYGDYNRWLQSVFIKMGWDAADAQDDPKIKEDIKQQTLKAATAVRWDSQEGFNIAGSLDGILRIGFQMCKKRHPELQYKQFEKEARKNLAASLIEINKIDQILNWSKKEDDQDSGGDPTVNNKSSTD